MGPEAVLAESDEESIFSGEVTVPRVPRQQFVVMIANRSLITAGIAKFLEAAEDVTIGSIDVADPQSRERIKAASPQTIVVDSGDASLPSGFITQILEDNPTVKVIAVDAARTGMEIFQISRWQQTELEGLLAVIRGTGVGTGRRSRT